MSLHLIIIYIFQYIHETQSLVPENRLAPLRKIILDISKKGAPQVNFQGYHTTLEHKHHSAGQDHCAIVVAIHEVKLLVNPIVEDTCKMGNNFLPF